MISFLKYKKRYLKILTRQKKFYCKTIPEGAEESSCVKVGELYESCESSLMEGLYRPKSSAASNVGVYDILHDIRCIMRLLCMMYSANIVT